MCVYQSKHESLILLGDAFMMQEKNPIIFVNPIHDSLNILFHKIEKYTVHICSKPLLRPSFRSAEYIIPIAFSKSDIPHIYGNFIVDTLTMERFLQEFLKGRMEKFVEIGNRDADSIIHTKRSGEKVFNHREDIMDYLVGKDIIARAEYFPERVHSLDEKLFVYGISSPKIVSSDDNMPDKIYLSNDLRSLEQLFRKTELVTAKVLHEPLYRPFVPLPMKYVVDFVYGEGLGKGYSDRIGYINLNTSDINAFMNMLGVESSEDAVGKEISVFVKIIKKGQDGHKRNSIAVLGVSNYSRYLNKLA